MPARCVVGGCSNVPNAEQEIALHFIPFFDDERPEAKKRRRQWVNFVRVKRAKWNPTKYSGVCSAHFGKEDFARKFLKISGISTRQKPRLITDEVGVVAIPRFYERTVDNPLSSRDKRNLSKEIRMTLDIDDNEEGACGSTEPELKQDEISKEASLPQPTHVETQTDGCVGCEALTKERRKIWNKYVALKAKLEASVKTKRSRGTQCDLSTEAQQSTWIGEDDIDAMQTDTVDTSSNQEIDNIINIETDADTFREDQYEDETDDESFDEDFEWETETETETESDMEADFIGDRVTVEGTSLRTEPKFIVFLTQLLLLFKFCHHCKTDNPVVETTRVGTAMVVTTTCSNAKCGRKNVWRSQPYMPGTKAYAGNFLLCFAILVSGGSASKVIHMFQHMGLSCISLATFFTHQRTKLFPTIYLHWKHYQKEMLEHIKTLGNSLVISGDGRHDSMGHSAKYGAYTIFCCSYPNIIHFSLIQRNEVGSSNAIEYAAFQRCMDFLLGNGLPISTFVSDRHASITKHMREELTNITHYFDIWHLKKKLNKMLKKLAKEAGCEELAEWIRPCENHLYWCATSTHSGCGRIIWAKFKSFLSHIIDKHEGLDDPLYNRCAHGDLAPRKWLLSDSVAYEKLSSAFKNKSLVKGIHKASPFDQTSCLEGFHSVVNQFAPKMIAYSFSGIVCRHILAAIHFNYNLHRPTKNNKNDGATQVRIVYPKFKNGEATVRDVKVEQNFAYVDELYQTFLQACSNNSLEDASKELKEMTPTPMNTMLVKESREDALRKKILRKSLVVENVQPTTPLSEVLEQEQAANAESRFPTARARPLCSVCKHPMKGHKNVRDCPKNQQNS